MCKSNNKYATDISLLQRIYELRKCLILKYKYVPLNLYICTLDKFNMILTTGYNISNSNIPEKLLELQEGYSQVVYCY